MWTPANVDKNEKTSSGLISCWKLSPVQCISNVRFIPSALVILQFFIRLIYHNVCWLLRTSDGHSVAELGAFVGRDLAGVDSAVFGTDLANDQVVAICLLLQSHSLKRK